MNKKEETLRDFAEQLGVDTDTLLERWEGRPDRIIDDLFRVQDIDTGEVGDLTLFDVQRQAVHAYFYGDASTLNTYKGRRIGYSFIFCACFLLEAMLYPNSYYPLVSRSLTQAKERISDIQNLVDHAKIDIPAPVKNKDYIELWNGSGFKAYSSDSDVARGDKSARAVLMDEMAFMEDEERAFRAFGPFLVLGKNRKMVEVSTPNTKGDLFMKEHRRGSAEGTDGVISIKQPTFYNAEHIDVHRSLFDQDIEPVRPDINISVIETERLSDPEGFGQEYLCRPVVDEYRFFDPDSIDAAMQRGEKAEVGLDAQKPSGWRRMMGVDIGIDHDDTVISISDKKGAKVVQRLLLVVDDEALSMAGVPRPDPGNANDVAELIAFIYGEMGVDRIVMDKGGVGQTFERIIERRLGRTVVGFDFSDWKSVNDMFGDTNMCLRLDDMTLVPDERLRDEMEAIVKQKKEDYSRPRYTGKDDSQTGKDDTAMATVLSAFPPKLNIPEAQRPAAKHPDYERREGKPKLTKKGQGEPEVIAETSYGATSVSRGTRKRRNRYRPRTTRYR